MSWMTTQCSAAIKIEEEELSNIHQGLLLFCANMKRRNFEGKTDFLWIWKRPDGCIMSCPLWSDERPSSTGKLLRTFGPSRWPTYAHHPLNNKVGPPPFQAQPSSILWKWIIHSGISSLRRHIVWLYARHNFHHQLPPPPSSSLSNWMERQVTRDRFD